MNRDYEIQCDPTGVYLWLSQRLPLQPTGSILEARTKLREAIRSLNIPDGQVLNAEYLSLDDSFFDVENVLLYNVGTGTFRNCASNGIVFSRRRVMPRTAPNGGIFPHSQIYTFSDIPELPAKPIFYSFVFEPPPLNTTTKLQDVWWRAADASSNLSGSLLGPFSIFIELTTSNSIANVAAIVKPFVDGVICAMHSDTELSPAAVHKLAVSRKWEQHAVLRKLRNRASGLLGERRLLSSYRYFVKWDPADHLCESCAFIIRKGSGLRCSVTVTPHG